MVDIYPDSRSGFNGASAPSILHPLEPLTAEEITAAVTILRTERKLGEHVRFASVSLHEPPKDIVLNFKAGDALRREAFVKLLDNSDGATYEAIVDVTAGNVASWQHIPGVQPSIMLNEFFACEQAVKNHPEFQAALAKRGVTDMSMVMVDPWSAGNYGAPDEQTKRLVRALSWVRIGSAKDNGYAHPIEGVLVEFDLNKCEVVRVIDNGVVPIPAGARQLQRRGRRCAY